MAEKATETRRRVEDALSRCLANAQILEGKWRSHIETEKLRLRALQQQQDEERERQVAVSRYVMQVAVNHNSTLHQRCVYYTVERRTTSR